MLRWIRFCLGEFADGLLKGGFFAVDRVLLEKTGLSGFVKERDRVVQGDVGLFLVAGIDGGEDLFARGADAGLFRAVLGIGRFIRRVALDLGFDVWHGKFPFLKVRW